MGYVLRKFFATDAPKKELSQEKLGIFMLCGGCGEYVLQPLKWIVTL